MSSYYTSAHRAEKRAPRGGGCPGRGAPGEEVRQPKRSATLTANPSNCRQILPARQRIELQHLPRPKGKQRAIPFLSRSSRLFDGRSELGGASKGRAIQPRRPGGRPFHGEVGGFLGIVGPFRGILGSFHGRVGQFHGEVGGFLGIVGPFHGIPGSFHGRVGQFHGIVEPFRGATERFRGTGQRFRGTVEGFHGTDRLSHGMIRGFRGTSRLSRGMIRGFRGTSRLSRGTDRLSRGANAPFPSGAGLGVAYLAGDGEREERRRAQSAIRRPAAGPLRAGTVPLLASLPSKLTRILQEAVPLSVSPRTEQAPLSRQTQNVRRAGRSMS